MIYGSNTPDDERDEAGTPLYIFDWANERFKFDVDLSADYHNFKMIPFISPREDSLTKNWESYGVSGWLNPPYSFMEPWLEKAIKHRANFCTVLLIPTPNGESQYKLIGKYASEIVMIHGRLSFIKPYSEIEIKGNPRGSCLVIFDNRRTEQNSCLLNWVSRDRLIRKYYDRQKELELKKIA